MGRGKKKASGKSKRTKEDWFSLLDEDEPAVGGVLIRELDIMVASRG